MVVDGYEDGVLVRRDFPVALASRCLVLCCSREREKMRHLHSVRSRCEKADRASQDASPFLAYQPRDPNPEVFLCKPTITRSVFLHL